MEHPIKRLLLLLSLFLSLNLSAVLKKSTPGKFAYTCHFQQIGINATNIENKGIHFKPDVFAAVAVVDMLKLPIAFARVRVLAIVADFAARSDLPILRTALQFLCQKLCSC